MFVILMFIFLCGTILGSFGNVLICRVPEGRTIGGRSQCLQCGRILRALELVPVIGYLLLKGRCRGCKNHISLQYPLVEIASGGLFLAAFWRQGLSIQGVALAFFLWLLLVIAVSDAKTQMIADVFNIPLLALGILYGLLHTGVLPVTLSLAVPAVFFGLQWVLSRGKWVGSGDIILGAAIGAATGAWEFSVLALTMAYIMGAFVAVWLLIRKKVTGETRLAFGPFLAAGEMVVLLWGERIVGMLFAQP